MADGKPLSKSKVIEVLAEKSGVSKTDVKSLLDAQAQLAYTEAKDGYTIAGIGKLVVVNRKARKGRNPATGQEIDIPAKTVLKFRLAKAAKDSAL
ncbi:MAG: DNA-binding protein HU-beta [Kiritimatiellia bacterium]|jgi:DNA-binding protein HU-beta